MALTNMHSGSRFNPSSGLCINLVIGASLSEPHTSVTALRMCVCVCMSVCLRPYTENFKRARLNFNITKMELGVKPEG